MYNERVFQIPDIFPKGSSDNLVICVPYKFRGEFSAFMINVTPDLHIIHGNQCFPLYTYVNNTKTNNILETTLQEYRQHYRDNNIKKIDIFYYVYGILHHPKYHSKFMNNLSKDLPNIPMAPNFTKISVVGERLSKLHLNFETCKRYKIRKLEKFGKPYKISFGKIGMKTDKTKIRVNGVLIFEDVPQVKYHVNGRTPLEWIVDRYNKTVDKDSGIVNNPLEGMDEDDIIAVIERAVYVGLETDRLIAELPDEFEPKNWKAKKAGLDAHMGE